MLLHAGAAAGAFEWVHVGARGWILGIDEGCWPSIAPAPRGWVAGVQRARPWDWPGVEALRVDAGVGGRGVAAAVVLTQLRTGDYREERWTLATACRATAHQWIGITLSGDALAVGDRRIAGHELSAGWLHARGGWRMEVVALGAWRASPAAALGIPQRFVAALGYRADGVAVDLVWSEETARTQMRLGVEIEAARSLRLRGAVATHTPRLRYGVGLARGELHADVAWLWHERLPPTQVVAIGWGGWR